MVTEENVREQIFLISNSGTILLSLTILFVISSMSRMSVNCNKTAFKNFLCKNPNVVIIRSSSRQRGKRHWKRALQRQQRLITWVSTKAILQNTFVTTKYSTPSQVVTLVMPFQKLSCEPLQPFSFWCWYILSVTGGNLIENGPKLKISQKMDFLMDFWIIRDPFTIIIWQKYLL